MQTPRPFPRALVAAMLAAALSGGVAAVGADVGNHAFEFLRLAPEPEGRALAGAHLAHAEGPAALAWNPAGLARGGTALSLSHAAWAEGTSWEWAGLTLPAGPGTAAISGGFFRTGALEGYTADGEATGEFTPLQFQLCAGYGLPLAGALGAGASIEAAFADDGSGGRRRAIACGGGLRLDAGPLALGLAALHLGPPLSLEEERYALPATVRLGASLEGLPGTLLHGALEWVSGEAVGLRAGVEWSPAAQFRLLGGGWAAPGQEGRSLHPTAGAVVDLGVTRFAYGFQPISDWESSHQVALTLLLD
ncbi:MAG: hypothetical protein FJY75_07370 [Candidatus Eisenbacteria bacterium]|uniref:PorV/PorQ family protein n=1 Tax=Eiseniibacteriota bacterium TaxID=2212470 RepID=A0A938BQX0_UNCEI|nr:hypothetical protein [Candidatus Eisenbacteria bacterium]